MALFTTTEIKKTANSPDHLQPLNDPLDFVICKSPDKLKALLDKIEDNKTVVFVSDGDWSMHDMIMQLLKRFHPADLYITTYAIRETSIRQIILAQEDGKLSSVNMLVDYRAQVRTPEVFQLAQMNMNSIKLTAIHAKACVLKTKTDSISIIGSANWTSNPRIEAGFISMDKDLANFNINWIQNVLDNAEIFE